MRRTLVPLALIASIVGACRTSPPGDRPTPSASPAPRVARSAPTFVGEASCASCHEREAAAWRSSQHAHAMQPASSATVLGDFRDARFTYDGVTSTFFRKGERYFVRTDGPDGALADFEITFTFGVEPLQQYLVDFPDGRKQALSIAWDTRDAAQGGRRWFHLYPDEHIDHRDSLHWTRLNQNWNFMCAECHSTNLRRNYDPAHDRYATTWSDVDVACEACHGPGSNHVAWAEQQPRGQGSAGDDGLVIRLDERRGATWTRPASGTATRTPTLASHREIETCAVCHARRVTLGTDPGPTGRLLDTHDLTLLDEPLYEVDGQQRGEVYSYGSFVQSKMYARGVTCSDCHEPHTQKLRTPGNAVCAPCHAPATYDATTHHLHAPGSAGGQCVACHMPTRTYMVIDPRHDHSMRVPRPDLTLADGAPNACNGCHADHDAAWAAAAIAAAHGPQRKGFQTFGAALRAGRRGAPGAAAQLAALVRDPAAPDIARATAASALERFPGAGTVAAITSALSDRGALVRVAALDVVTGMAPPTRAALAAPLAADPVKAVRVKAGRALPGAQLDGLAPEVVARCRRAIDEYVAAQQASAERPEAHLNLGIIYAESGAVPRSEAEYRTAIRLQPDFVPAYVNLADLFRALGREDDAAAALADGLTAVPDDPSLLHALGLQRVRQQRSAEALPLLQRAAESRPENSRFAYVYAVALHSSGRPDEAITIMKKALERAPYDPDLLSGLAAFSRDAGRLDDARDYAARLAAVAPPDEARRDVGAGEQ
jgi:Flp pilus assembly protein TadD